jgi:hypothetical protein
MTQTYVYFVIFLLLATSFGLKKNNQKNIIRPIFTKHLKYWFIQYKIVSLNLKAGSNCKEY